mmetsp:Transcript_33314/g.42865  ORF Transcript_33314/g.42865 Transcript_33314/m.42865 type:complete len:142 (+) Transcript_33314:2-427(+)
MPMDEFSDIMDEEEARPSGKWTKRLRERGSTMMHTLHPLGGALGELSRSRTANQSVELSHQSSPTKGPSASSGVASSFPSPRGMLNSLRDKSPTRDKKGSKSPPKQRPQTNHSPPKQRPQTIEEVSRSFDGSRDKNLGTPM